MTLLAIRCPYTEKLVTLAVLAGCLLLLYAVPTTAMGDEAAAYVVTSSNDFGKIDLATGNYTQIGHMDGLPRSLGGLGTAEGKLFGGAIRTGNLYEVDASNGRATLVGTGKLSYFVTGSTTNGLYAVAQDMNLYSIDAKSGVARLIGPTGFDAAEVGGGALSAGAEKLYMSATHIGSYNATLYELDTASGAASVVGPIGSGTGAPPMVFAGEALYAALNFPSKKLCQLNIARGAPSCFASLSGVPGYSYGLAPASLLTTARAFVHKSESDVVTPRTGASVVKGAIRLGATSIDLPAGQMYIYGMATGGGAPSSEFASGQYASVVNTAGRLSDALAYGTSNPNSYNTQTGYHEIGGVSVAGSWAHFTPYYGLNRQRGAHDASVSFQANEDSLVVVIGLASSQQSVSIEGVPNIQVDASRNGGGMVITHAYVKPGNYTVTEHSQALSAGQDPSNMADLVGVFVFEGNSGTSADAVAPGPPHGVKSKSTDVLNFDYPSACSEQFDGFPKVIHVSNGEWKKDDVGSFMIRKQASGRMVTHGDLKGDGQTETAVVTSCYGQGNFDYEEIFVVGDGSKLLAKLSPPDWGKGQEDNGGNFMVTDFRISGQLLDVSFWAGGFHACAAWTVTAEFRWNGNGFTRTKVTRQPHHC